MTTGDDRRGDGLWEKRNLPFSGQLSTPAAPEPEDSGAQRTSHLTLASDAAAMAHSHLRFALAAGRQKKLRVAAELPNVTQPLKGFFFYNEHFLHFHL